MEELMTANTCNGAKKADQHCKTDIITISFRFLNAIEQVSLWVIFLTHYNTCPNRCKGFKENKELQWEIKPFVFSECDL